MLGSSLYTFSCEALLLYTPVRKLFLKQNYDKNTAKLVNVLHMDFKL